MSRRHADCSKAPKERPLNLNEFILNPDIGIEIPPSPDGDIFVVTKITKDRVQVVQTN